MHSSVILAELAEKYIYNSNESIVLPKMENKFARKWSLKLTKKFAQYYFITYLLCKQTCKYMGC